MDSSIAFQAVAILILIALSSFFSSAETAMTTVNRFGYSLLPSRATNVLLFWKK